MTKVIVKLDKFKPRDYQLKLIKAFEVDKFKRLLVIWPRRAGKDFTCLNILLRAALRRVATYYIVLPTFSQGRRTLWDAITNDGERFRDFIPTELIQKTNEQQMKITLVNNSVIQVVGSDDFNALVGVNLGGAIFSEYALQDPRGYQYIRPILVANEGFAIFISTPRGRNSLWDLYQIAIQHPDWWVSHLTVEDTKHISMDLIDKERAEGVMSDDLIQQEYFCSFQQGIEGAYYSKYIDRMRFEHRIGVVAWEPSFQVHTAWDIGVRDSTAIIFFQCIGQTIRIIDYYENSKVGLEHYVHVLGEKPYTYGRHIAPHDMKVQEFGSGMTRLDKARHLGIRFAIAPDIGIMDGIEQVRSIFGRLWIDETKCKDLIRYLENYRQEWDPKRKVYKSQPLHDNSSHACFTSDTLVLTRSGMRPIIDVRDNYEILTLNGWEKCIGAKSTRKNVSVLQITFVDGVKVKCTPDHLFLTESGWISAENLSKDSMILSASKTDPINIMAKPIDYGDSDIINTLLEEDYIKKCGVMRLARYQKNVISITQMKTKKIILLKTWYVCRNQNTLAFRDPTIKVYRRKQDWQPQNGTQAKQEENGILSTQKELKTGRSKLEYRASACIVKKKLCYCNEKTIIKDSATPIVRHLMVEKIERIEGLFDVWCINVPIAGHFALSNGAIVHNSDAMRYLAISLPKVKDGLSQDDIDRKYKEKLYGADIPKEFINPRF